MADFEKVYRIKFDTKDAEKRLMVLQGGLNGIDKTIGKIGREGKRSIDRASGSFAKLGRKIKKIQLKKLSKQMTDMGKAATLRLTVPIVASGAAMIKFASDYDEALNKVRVSFKDSSKSVEGFAKTTLKQFGIAEGTALDMAALFGDMGTSMGLTTGQAAKMSTKMVGLAGDLASFKNIKVDIAQTALAGVFTGETESLKKLGIVMTIANLEQFAMEQGIKKSVKEMTQAEKVQLRYAFIVSKSANAQGDFARTGDSAANQSRKFTEGAKQLAQTFGKHMLPMFTKAVEKLNALIEKFGALSPEMQKNILIVGAVVAAIGPLLFIGGKLLLLFGALKTASLFLLANPILLAIAAVIGGLALLYTNWDTVVKGFELGITSIVEYFWRAVKGIMQAANWLADKVGIDSLFDTKDMTSKINELAQQKGNIFGGDQSNGEKYRLSSEGQSVMPGYGAEYAMQTAAGGADYGKGVQNNYGGSTTVNVSGAGNPNEVARAVGRELKKRDRRQAKQMRQTAQASTAGEV